MPLVGVLLLDWSLFEVVLVAWIEAAIVLVAASAKFAIRRPMLAALVLPALLPAATILLVLQLAFLVLWFGLDAAQKDFFGLALGLPAMGARLLWATLALVAFQALAFWLRFLRGPERSLPAWRLLFAPILHVAAMQAILVAAAYLVRAKADATPALALLVALKIGVDLALYAIEVALAPDEVGSEPPIENAA